MSQELLELALTAAGMATWEIDFATLGMEASPALRALIGQPDEGPLTFTALERAVYADDLPALRAGIAGLMQGEELRCNLRIRRSDGRIGRLSMSGRAARDAQGRPVRGFGVMHGSEETQTLERFVHDRRSQWTLMFDADNVGMAQIDPWSGRMLRVNERLAAMVGAMKPHLVGRRFLSLLHPGERASCLRRMHALIKAEASSFEAEQRLLHPREDQAWALIIVSLLRSASGEPSHFMALMLDITERKRAEQALKEREEQLRNVRAQLEQRVEWRTAELASANAALLSEIAERRVAENQVRELLTRLVQNVEEERRRISRELHDTLGQHLAVLAIGLKAMEADLAPSPDALGRLARVQNALNNVEEQLDRIAYELRPSALDDLGLAEALRSHVDTWSRESGIAAELHMRGLDAARLPSTVENTVYRVVQEALTNVHKHAQASRVGVIVERRGDELRVVVEDDGRGFDSAPTEPAGGRRLGLRGMSERASLVAGSLEIESVPGRGTTIYLVIPVAAELGVPKDPSAC